MTAENKEAQPVIKVSDLSLAELAPYIKGEKKLDREGEPTKLTESVFQDFWNQLNMQPLYKTLLDVHRYYKDFFNAAYELGKLFPEEIHEDLFYAAKVGYFYDGIPSYLVYTIKECLTEYKCPNLIVKMIPHPHLRKYFSNGTLSKTLYDVIASEFGKDYQVLDDNHLISRYEEDEIAEIYIPKEDMVAIVPIQLANVVQPDFIESLELYEDGLASPDGVYLNKLAGYHGVCNSYYDLRNLV